MAKVHQMDKRMKYNSFTEVEHDLVVFGTFDGLQAFGFNRLHGIHRSPEILEFRHRPELIHTIHSDDEQVLFFITIHPIESSPLRLIGLLFKHKDNAGRDGHFGVGHIVDNSCQPTQALTIVSDYAKMFFPNRYENWKILIDQFKSINIPSQFQDQSFQIVDNSTEMYISASVLKSLWSEIFTLIYPIDSLSDINIYLVKNGGSSDLKSLISMISSAFIKDKSLHKKTLHENFQLKTHLKEAKNFSDQLRKKLESIEAPSSSVSPIIQSRLIKLLEFEKSNLAELNSIIANFNTQSNPRSFLDNSLRSPSSPKSATVHNSSNYEQRTPQKLSSVNKLRSRNRSFFQKHRRYFFLFLLSLSLLSVFILIISVFRFFKG